MCQDQKLGPCSHNKVLELNIHSYIFSLFATAICCAKYMRVAAIIAVNIWLISNAS